MRRRYEGIASQDRHPHHRPGSRSNRGKRGNDDEAPPAREEESKAPVGYVDALFVRGLALLALTDDDAATRLHAADACRLALDAGAPDDSEGDEFLAEFYEHYMPWLVEPLYDCGVEDNRVKRGPACACSCEYWRVR